MELFRADAITKRYAGHTALDKVSINVPKGSIFGLLGPNGAGKTSLLRIINQITAPDEGTLFFEGEKLSPHHIEQIGYLPEERGLYKKMKVGEQAMYLARLKGLSQAEARTRLKHWFEKMEIQSWWDKKIEELSKGMAQKVQFIVTVLHEPKLLIFDEPFSGFDPINANLIKNEILELNKKGATIIFSTHRMESVEELCNHITLINKSKKILDGPIREIRQKYRSNTYELSYKAENSDFLDQLPEGFEVLSRGENELKSASIKLSNGHSPNQLLEALLPKAEIHRFVERIPSVNDIFIQAVNETA